MPFEQQTQKSGTVRSKDFGQQNGQDRVGSESTDSAVVACH